MRYHVMRGMRALRGGRRGGTRNFMNFPLIASCGFFLLAIRCYCRCHGYCAIDILLYNYNSKNKKHKRATAAHRPPLPPRPPRPPRQPSCRVPGGFSSLPLSTLSASSINIDNQQQHQQKQPRRPSLTPQQELQRPQPGDFDTTEGSRTDIDWR